MKNFLSVFNEFFKILLKIDFDAGDWSCTSDLRFMSAML